MRICEDNLLKQWYSLQLLSAGLEGESKLILCIEWWRSERESALQDRDGFLVLSVGNQRLGELNLSEGAFRRKLGRGPQLLHGLWGSLFHHEREAKVQVRFDEIWIEADRFFELAYGT